MTIKVLAIVGLAGLTAGCFQPMYAEKTLAGTAPVDAGLKSQMASVEVAEVKTSVTARLDRVGVELRNNLIFALTGGSGGGASQYRLNVSISGSQQQVIVDINSGRPDIQNYGIDASYTLVDIGTGKPVVTGQTFARVSYNIPGQMQRFAGDRGLRDAETRAAKVISDNIRNRLASYFTAGT
jgi:LPS-assembly lipoprotein